MSILSLVVLVLIFCLLWYAISFVPTTTAPGGRELPIRSILYVLLIVVAVVYLLRYV